MSGFLERWFARRRDAAPVPAERRPAAAPASTSPLFPDAGRSEPGATASPAAATATIAAAGAAAVGGTLVVAASAARLLAGHDTPPVPGDAAAADAETAGGEGGVGADTAAGAGLGEAPSFDLFGGDGGSAGGDGGDP